MERRALIAVVISLVVLVVYQEFILKRWYPPPTPEEASSESAPVAPAANPQASAPLLDEAAQAEKPSREGQRIRVETDLYIATFNTAGARLESFQLKNYQTTVDPGSPLQETVVPGQGGELPFGVELRGANVSTIGDTNAVYSTTATSLTLKDGESGSLEFTWHGDPLTVQKQFTFRGNRYEFESTVSAENVPAQYTEMGITWVKGIETVPYGTEAVFDKTALVKGRTLVEYTFDKLADPKTDSGDADAAIGWAGFSGRHFLEAVIPESPQNPRVFSKVHDRTVDEKIQFPIASGAATTKLDVYIGPKDFDALETVGHNLSDAVALGRFWFIALPLLHALKFLHRFAGNYGIAIILLTMGIKILF